MYGGTLLSSTILTIEDQDLLLAAFSNSCYLFSLREGTIQGKATYHDHRILGLYYDEANKVVTSVDESGLVVEKKLSKKGKLQKHGKSRKSFEGDTLIQVSALQNQNGQIQLFGVTSSHTVLRNSENMTGLVHSECSKILYLSPQHLILRTASDKLSIVDPYTLQPRFDFTHTCEITAVQIYEKNLLVGDINGKITVLNGFLEDGEVKLRQKLQWHVHEITALRVEGAYLYSSGEEGVVVMWHLRQNKRDFLPRIGAKILNFMVKEANIFCCLADNTIKRIDLGQDKTIVLYKTVVGCKMDNSSLVSAQKVKNSLVRVSGLEDRLFLRGMPGRIQQLNLSNGLNSEHEIVSRNLISRLDSHFPSPHQITDICLSRDGSKLAVTVEGINSRQLRFYQSEGDSYTLVSKVQNVHEGCQSINLVLFGQRFISYSLGDKAVKIWKLMSQKKQSILSVDEPFWGCEYEISFRSKTPLFVSLVEEKITVAFKNEFVVFNTHNRTIENVFQTEKDKQIKAVYQLKTKTAHTSAFLVVFRTTVEVMEFSKQGHTSNIVITLNANSAVEPWNLSFNCKHQALSILVDEAESQSVYIYKVGTEAQQYQIERKEESAITDVFWLGERAVVLNSQLIFFDLTHGKDLIQFENNKERTLVEKKDEEMEVESQLLGDYDTLCSRYLQRQFRKDRLALEKTSEIFSVTPSITASFDYLARQLFL